MCVHHPCFFSNVFFWHVRWMFLELCGWDDVVRSVVSPCESDAQRVEVEYTDRSQRDEYGTVEAVIHMTPAGCGCG